MTGAAALAFSTPGWLPVRDPLNERAAIDPPVRLAPLCPPCACTTAAPSVTSVLASMITSPPCPLCASALACTAKLCVFAGPVTSNVPVRALIVTSPPKSPSVVPALACTEYGPTLSLLIVMLCVANRSIHARVSSVVLSVTPSACTSPLFGKMLSILMLFPQISTHAVYLFVVGCVTVSRLQWFAGLLGSACPPLPAAVDRPSPFTTTSHPSRCTKSAPGSLPSLLTIPSGVIVSAHPAFSVIGPPPGGCVLPTPDSPPNDRTSPSTSICSPAVITIAPPEPVVLLASTALPGCIVSVPTGGTVGKFPALIVMSPAFPPAPSRSLLDMHAPAT